ncbi:MAG: hypothetical protein IJ344_01280 [Clostridia bacterium]|nr:hypothetical protein [Clostridia bacterium]
MKKVLTILLMALMVVNMSVAAFAAPGSFITSPSRRPAPELIKGEPEEDECSAEVVITPYSERDTLPEALRLQMEDAYAQIVAATDLTTFSAELAALAEEKGIPATDLAVSDLFDIRYVGCDDHRDHSGYFEIVFKAETLKNFVGLLHLYNGEWELITNATKYEEDGEHYLSFKVEEFSPFAIVVNTGNADPNPPQAGIGNMIPVYASIMVVSAVAIVLIVRKSKKQGA